MYFCPDWDKVLLDEVKSLSHDDFYLSGTMIEPNSGHIVYDFGIDIDTFKEDELLSKYKNINFLRIIYLSSKFIIKCIEYTPHSEFLN